MNDDEVFIRAIVDSPGDDTPRLVYADWLQDNDYQQRAAYIRAEAEWVRTGKKVKALQKLGVVLDPVWVYRVSRSPVGVCLAKVLFAERGPELKQEQLLTDSTEYPPEYRAFLLNYNGGLLVEDVCDGTAQDDCEIRGFASIGNPDQYDRFVSEDDIPTVGQLKDNLVHPNGHDRVLTSCTPIAYVCGDFDAYNCLLLQPPSKRHGKKPLATVVYYRNPSGQEWSEEDVDELDEAEDEEGDNDDDDESDESRRDRLWNSMDVNDFVTKVASNLPTFLATLCDHTNPPAASS